MARHGKVTVWGKEVSNPEEHAITMMEIYNSYNALKVEEEKKQFMELLDVLIREKIFYGDIERIRTRFNYLKYPDTFAELTILKQHIATTYESTGFDLFGSPTRVLYDTDLLNCIKLLEDDHTRIINSGYKVPPGPKKDFTDDEIRERMKDWTVFPTGKEADAINGSDIFAATEYGKVFERPGITKFSPVEKGLSHTTKNGHEITLIDTIGEDEMARRFDAGLTELKYQPNAPVMLPRFIDFLKWSIENDTAPDDKFYLNFKEYAEQHGIKKADTAAEQVFKCLGFLMTRQINVKTGKGDSITAQIIDATVKDRTRGGVNFRIGATFSEIMKANKKTVLINYSILGAINDRENPHARDMLRYLTKRVHINKLRTNNKEAIKVSSLLKELPLLPEWDTKTRKSQLIIDPFERDLNYLQEAGGLIWKYRNPEEYFPDRIIEYSIPNHPDLSDKTKAKYTKRAERAAEKAAQLPHEKSKRGRPKKV